MIPLDQCTKTNRCSQFCQLLLGPQDIAQRHFKQAFTSDLVCTRRVSHFVWGALESILLVNHLVAYGERYYNDYFAWKSLIAHWEDAPLLEMTINPTERLDLARLASDMTSTFMQATDSENRPVFLFKTSNLDQTNICLVMFSDRTCRWKVRRCQPLQGSYGGEYRGKPYVESLFRDCPELKTYLKNCIQKKNTFHRPFHVTVRQRRVDSSIS